MATILDGKKFAEIILNDVKMETQKSDVKPSLTVILVGDDPASLIYVNKKQKIAQDLGFTSNLIKMPVNTSEDELLGVIDKLNQDENTSSILLQLPLPKHLNEHVFTSFIDPKKDVDGFHPLNLGKLLSFDKPYAYPCTPFGIIKLLKHYNIEFEGANVVIVGRSNIVGKPLGMMFLKENATVTIAHSKTKNLCDITKTADILVCATGKPKLIKADMVKKGAIVVDVGISRLADGKISGDVDFQSVSDVASFITPVPNGVGPVTVAMLMFNALSLAKNNK